MAEVQEITHDTNEMVHQQQDGYESAQQPGEPGDVQYSELVKQELLEQYKANCEQAELEPHEAFVTYLEETLEENDGLDLVIQGNDKYNFTNRIDDEQLLILCNTLRSVAIYISDIDLRFNKITDTGAKALADLISKAPRLLGLNLQGNAIKSEGA